MKNVIVCLFALALLAQPAFAQAWCEQDCCEESGGTWDSEFGMCDGSGSSYSSCLDEWCTQDDISGSVSCCGSAMVLAALGAFAFVARR